MHRGGHRAGAVIEPHLHERLDEFNRIDSERQARIQRSLAQTGTCPVDTALAFGRPGPEIVRFAAEKNCSLVVMGTQGRGALVEAFLGSVSHYVARHSPAPTLLIPHP
jgi:nucleotide-binding universal stress UspA family protein